MAACVCCGVQSPDTGPQCGCFTVRYCTCGASRCHACGRTEAHRRNSVEPVIPTEALCGARSEPSSAC